MGAQVEPRSEDSKVRDRLDIQLVGSQGVLLVDVSVCQPTAKSYCVASSRKAGSAAHKRELLKHARYDNLATRQRALLFPFVLETFGYIGQEGQKLLRAISKEAALSGPYDENDFHEQAVTRVAFSSTQPCLCDDA